MSLRVVRYLSIELLPKFIESLKERKNTYAVIAVRKNSTYAVHLDTSIEEAKKSAEYWHIKFGTAATIYINTNTVYGKIGSIEQEYREENNDKTA